jgi:hypothetical protein
MLSLGRSFSSRLARVTPLFLALLLVACGGDDATSLPKPSGSTVTPPPPPPPPPPSSPALRTLGTGTLQPTTTQNLLLDPGFFLTEQGGQIAGAFLAVYEQGQGQLQLRVRIDSTSPAGFGGGVVLARDPKATDEKARSIQFLAAFTGGKGPFVAKVWVSATDAAGAPRALPEDGGGFEASVLDPARQSSAADLVRDPEKTKRVGGRTWSLYTGQLTRDLVGGGMMLMTTGSKGGGFELAAPEIVAISAANGVSRIPTLTERPLKSSEREAIATYGKIPKRLEPAKAGERSPRPTPAKLKR